MTIILFIAIILIAFIAYKRNKLTIGGAIAAALVGCAISLGLGIFGLLLLGIFFFSSILVGSFPPNENELGIVQKGQQRDTNQVFANGGVSALLAFIYFLNPSEILICGFVASLAAANSDTWASELGSHSKKKPYHLMKRKHVSPGMSGAITSLGLAASIAGSFLIVIFSIIFWWGPSYGSLILLLALTLAGFLGNLVDTVLGGVWQVVYRCPVCLIETERENHCNRKTERIKGKKWMDNDIVNIGCTVFGAAVGLFTGWLLL
ncbi:DUF92 domain-containing protein [Halalkalibacter okhensis]|uniref:Transmenbrane protein n=1 Tax=Halalkalibacter okhensis TaxID=333138 RepID=A0A0B0ILV3_9BACI|nr:DUF92 domain-containing protein [Halalkalibacter okhensis]KHF41832.1 hypothetical protein LQ50_00605 [Halalkalibacter okhensis]